ncbi:hypothetical protein M408DRAFT_330518 [Serendipita vermifera MAFF 305830]|uniref:Uncharacterized protein n=1 Tax=Serendipita vermifera MAFF 305830 TaxID=933852 RepID=A0A0C3B527_SERVB|nr:hypothetical protein M408DRAFT_330518 [Serendipita vermifera MAFF 305830]
MELEITAPRKGSKESQARRMIHTKGELFNWVFPSLFVGHSRGWARWTFSMDPGYLGT